MNKADRIFRLSARTFCVSVVLMFIALILRWVLDSAIPAQRPGLIGVSGLILQIVGFIAAVAFLVSSLILWGEGCFLIISGWKERSVYLNMLLILFLIFGNILAALVLHFARARSMGSDRAAA